VSGTASAPDLVQGRADLITTHLRVSRQLHRRAALTPH
jgi:hypothetical protein